MAIGLLGILYVLFWIAVVAGTIGLLIYFLVKRPGEVESDKQEFEQRDN